MTRINCAIPAIAAAVVLLNATASPSAEFGSHPPSVLRGAIDGCTDGQKRQLKKQGLPYEGNEELVRQYCHCMAPIVADLSSTREGQLKMLDGDPLMRERLRKADAICLDGIANGRLFAPPTGAPSKTTRQ